MHVLIHCNGGPRIGTGHVVRSIALAEEAVARGHQVTFAGRIDGKFLHGLLSRLLVVVRDDEVSLSELTLRLRPEVVHLDTYDEVSDDLGTALVSSIEDGVFGRRRADLVVDPNLGADAEPRPAISAPVLLRGSSYVPLRAAVTSRRGRWTARDVASKVLVVMGGTDPHALSAPAVAALAATGVPLDVTVVGPPGRHAECREATSGLPDLRLDLRSEVDDLPALMIEQDLVVSAAGTTVWELCCLGVPMALVCAADNQQVGYDRVVGAGVAAGLGQGLVDHEAATARLGALLLDGEARRALADRASEAVDGRGAWRVVSAWEQLVASGVPEPATGGDVLTRPATMADAETLLRWRNDPETRAASRATGVVSSDSHRSWLEQSLSDDDRLLLIGSDRQGEVGTVRWDRQCGRTWEVSITVAPERRGSGVARRLLAAAELALAARSGPPLHLLAAVRDTNAASQTLFVRSGYLPEAPADEEGFSLFRKQLGR